MRKWTASLALDRPPGRPAALGLRGVHVAAERRGEDRRRGHAAGRQESIRDERRAAAQSSAQI